MQIFPCHQIFRARFTRNEPKWPNKRFYCSNFQTRFQYHVIARHTIGPSVKNTLNALFLIAHTGAEVRENQSRLIDENDIRGSKAITTLVEFLYILQPIWVNQTLYQFLKIKKHRGQDLMHGLYRLNYKKDIKAFENDISVDFEKFADTFKLRNKLAK